MNKLSAITTAIIATYATATANGVLPAKYAAYAMLAATFVQAFQGAVHQAPPPTNTDSSK